MVTILKVFHRRGNKFRLEIYNPYNKPEAQFNKAAVLELLTGLEHGIIVIEKIREQLEKAVYVNKIQKS